MYITTPLGEAFPEVSSLGKSVSWSRDLKVRISVDTPLFQVVPVVPAVSRHDSSSLITPICTPLDLL